MSDGPTAGSGAEGRLARLRGGLAAEHELLESLSSVLTELRRVSTRTEAQLDLDAGWGRVELALEDEP